MSGGELDAHPLHVLMLEDEAVNRALVRAVLSRTDEPELRNATVHEATTIAEARAVLDGGKVDLALLDVRLPDGSGLDLARQITAGRHQRRPLVVVVSASVFPEERSAAKAAGSDAFLPKPYRPSELVETLVRLLRETEAAAAP